MKKNKIIKKNQGAAMILVVFFFVFISLTILIGIVTPSVREYKIVNNNYLSKQSYFTAESGIEDMLCRLKNNKLYDPVENLILGTSEVQTTIQDLSGTDKEIISLGQMNNFERKITTNVTAGRGISFSYGVQVGQGGFIMDNNSIVDGSVYSNGIITGSGTITGSAISANSSNLNADQSNALGVPTHDIIFGNQVSSEDFAQSFQMSSTDVVNKVEFYIKKIGNPANLIVKITTNNNGQPSNTILTSGEMSSSLISTNYGWVEVPFSTNPQLQVGNTYWLVIDGASSSSKYYSMATNQDGYLLGLSKIGRYGATWSNNSPADLDSFFKLYTGGVNGLIDGITVGQEDVGIAYAHTVNDSTVEGILYCQLGTNNNKNCDTSRSDPVQVAMPISEQNIIDWKNEAETGGVYTGNYILSESSASLGPKKIDGNFTITNGSTLTLTGTLWVTGNIIINNLAKIKLSPIYESSESAIIADGLIDINNNASFSGSGVEGSYIMVLTTSSSPEAIDLGNNAGAILLYAANGTINVANNAGAKSLTAHYIHLEENAEIIYESGLINSNFVGGPSGTWNFSGWREIE